MTYIRFLCGNCIIAHFLCFVKHLYEKVEFLSASLREGGGFCEAKDGRRMRNNKLCSKFITYRQAPSTASGPPPSKMEAKTRKRLKGDVLSGEF